MNQNVNLVFYKYYDGCGVNDRNLKVISDFEIYFSKRSQLNDPFDTFPIAEIPTPDQVRFKISRMLDNGPRRNPNLTQQSVDEVKRKWEQDEDGQIRLQQQFWSNPETIKAFCDQYSVLCLARSPLNKLMWSHYGKNHSGFALEFDFISVLDNPPDQNNSEEPDFMPQDVHYTNKRPGFQSSNTEKILLSKDDIWKYENEHRIIFHGPNGLYRYQKNFLKSVYLGSEISDKTKTKIVDVINGVNRDHKLNIAINQISMSSDSYELLSHPC